MQCCIRFVSVCKGYTGTEPPLSPPPPTLPPPVGGRGGGGDRHSFAVCCTPPYLQGLELAVSSFVFSTTACETSCAKQSELGKLVTCFAKIRILRNTKYETVNPSASHPPPLTTCFTNTAEGWGGGRGRIQHTAESVFPDAGPHAIITD